MTIIVRVTEIINEIDVYLLRLQKARDLLGASTKAKQHSRARSRQTAISARKRVLTTRRVQPLSEKKLPAGITTGKPKLAAENPSESQNRVSLRVEANERNQPAFSAPEPALHQVEGALVLRREDTRATPQRRRPVRREKAARAKLETSPKPATASSKPVPTGWIVVSAEEAKRQREPVSHVAQVRTVTPSRGLTGRRAFDALFGDTYESSAASPNSKH